MTRFLCEHKYKLITILILILLGLWSWYFFVYSYVPGPQNAIWNKADDKQKFMKFKAIAENKYEKEGYKFLNYIDTPTFDNYSYSMTEEGFKIIGQREWEEEFKDMGRVKLRQKFVTIATFNEEDMTYLIKSQVQSKRCILRQESQWKDWDAGNAKISFICTDKELNQALFDVSGPSVKLDLFIKSTLDKLRGLFGGAKF